RDVGREREQPPPLELRVLGLEDLGADLLELTLQEQRLVGVEVLHEHAALDALNQLLVHVGLPFSVQKLKAPLNRPSDPSDPWGPSDPSDPSDPWGPWDPSDPSDPWDPSDPRCRPRR